MFLAARLSYLKHQSREVRVQFDGDELWIFESGKFTGFSWNDKHGPTSPTIHIVGKVDLLSSKEDYVMFLNMRSIVFR